MEDAVIAGAGPIGLACAVSAKRRGLDPLLLDAGVLVHSITRYPIGMTFFTTPERMEIGGHPLVCAGQKPTREEALKYYRGVARVEGVRFQAYRRFVAAERRDGSLECVVTSRGGEERIRARRLVLATGYFDHPNLIGVPGEDLPHVSHYFDEPHGGYGLDVVVIGGRNSAAEAALELFRAGAHVTLVYRGKVFPPTLETNAPGIHMAGSISSGRAISEIFIENGRFDGEKIFSNQPPSSTAG